MSNVIRNCSTCLESIANKKEYQLLFCKSWEGNRKMTEDCPLYKYRKTPEFVEHTKMQIEIRELKEQIEKMKNYANCKIHRHIDHGCHDVVSENVKLKQKIELLNAFKEENRELRGELFKLHMRINKLKNNSNCYHGIEDYDGSHLCDLNKYMTTCPCEKWTNDGKN